MGLDHEAHERAAGFGEDPLYRRFVERNGSALASVEELVTRIVSFRAYQIPRQARPDLIQEALLQIWQECSKPGFAFRENFGAFARMVAYRRCLDYRRARRIESCIPPDTPDRGLTPDLALLARERADLAGTILRNLKQSCRELMRLHILENRSYGEISKLWDRTEGALRTEMWQCLKEAREILDRIRGKTGPGEEPRRTG